MKPKSPAESAPDAFALPVLTHAAGRGNEVPAWPPAAGEHGYGKSFWRSIEENLGGPEFKKALEREFPEGATQPPEGLERREFLSLLGASLALAGLNACTSRPPEKILPYTRTPAGLAPGNPLHFATAATLDGYANGLLVTSWEGRPTKVEGNPDHSYGRGATGLFEQALILSLYDPHRPNLIKEKGEGRAWRTFLGAVAARAAELKKEGGAKLRFLLEPSSSPLLGSLRRRILQAFPKARFYGYAPSSEDNSRAGAQLAFGRRLDVRLELAKADVILSLDADFLQPTPRQVKHTGDFARRRDPKAGPLNRLYVVESALTVTGSSADNRLRLKSSEVQGFAMAVLAELPGYARLQGTLQRMLLPFEHQRWASTIASDLLDHRGRCLAVAGDRQPPLVHALAQAINGALGNIGNTVQYFEPLLNDDRTGVDSLRELAEELRRGQVDTLVIAAHNPAYASAADLELGDSLAKVPNVIYRGFFEDETAAHAHWFIPATHFLESWGDARAANGAVSIVQPLIAPLFSGYTEVDLLSAFLGEGDKGTYTHLRDFWQKEVGGGFTDWETWLGEGIVPSPAPAPQTPAVQADKVLAAARAAPIPDRGGLEVNFLLDYRVHDGRFGNNSWLQELPDPITKLTWDNAALVSPATARKLGLESGQVVTLSLRGRQLDAPVWVLPGHADEVVSLPLGYGRTSRFEPVARDVGFNAYALMRSGAPWFDSELKLAKTDKKHAFAVTQEHWSMQATPTSEPRPLALEQSLERYQSDPTLTAELRGPLPTLQPPVKYDGYKWAMAVDLSRCIGCSACVLACQSENNIPTVGKKQVMKGREMNWLRIDRYFQGPLDNPTVIPQPVACVHCEAAPCEYVCPVNATVHSDEGLNEMVYNRCVGTRYCSNNCPYKVRRFNYLHWNANLSAVEAMRSNPDVTVRARGVMEKCTYCVQRIERARITTRVEGRAIREGDIKTACQQACPAQAIWFGNLNDENSRVAQLHRDNRRYDLLHELNTRPRTAYLVRIKNPNPELA